jgi:hypothetical protein
LCMLLVLITYKELTTIISKVPASDILRYSCFDRKGKRLCSPRYWRTRGITKNENTR